MGLKKTKLGVIGILKLPLSLWMLPLTISFGQWCF